MDSTTLEQVIRTHVNLGRKNTKGWEECLHPICDRGKKGNRAAFLFEGETTAFHCFNCGTKTVYDPLSHKGMPKVMEGILSDFGIPPEDWKRVILGSLQLKNSGAHREEIKRNEKIEPKPLKVPSCFYLLDNAEEDDAWAEIARYYLTEERMIDPDSHPFMLCDQSNPAFKKWVGRLIIPIMKDDNVVFYQGRDLSGKEIKKYESPPDPKDRVIFGFDKLYKDRDKPLYVVEGVFDAMLINGVALMGNDITPAQFEWLDRSPRQKVYIPDRYGDGQLGANKALERGWSVSIPWERSWDTSLKDITDMIAKYGKMFVMARLVEMTSTGVVAKSLILRNCVKKQ